MSPNHARRQMEDDLPIPREQWACYCHDLRLPYKHTMGDHDRLRKPPQ